jgi:hypothetical protein
MRAVYSLSSKSSISRLRPSSWLSQLLGQLFQFFPRQGKKLIFGCFVKVQEALIQANEPAQLLDTHFRGSLSVRFLVSLSVSFPVCLSESREDIAFHLQPGFGAVSLQLLWAPHLQYSQGWP